MLPHAKPKAPRATEKPYDRRRKPWSLELPESCLNCENPFMHMPSNLPIKKQRLWMKAFYNKVLEEKKDLDAKKAELTSQQRGTYNYARNILMKPNVGIDAEDDDDSDSEDEDKDVIVIDD